MADPFELVHEVCYLGRPLGATLVGVTAWGEWLVDGATALCVDPAWARGFLGGFLRAGETSRGWGFVEGFEVAEEVRTLHYPEHLPDRR